MIKFSLQKLLVSSGKQKKLTKEIKKGENFRINIEWK